MMDLGALKTADVVKRYEGNPVLRAEQAPYKADLVFNAGVTKWRGEYIMVFRNDYTGADPRRLEGTNLGLARSADGIDWKIDPEPCFALRTDEYKRAYDPRLTVIDDRLYMCFAVDTKHGVRGGVAVTDDLKSFEILSLSTPDNRNMVLFPEKIGGKFVRLERPFPIYSRGHPERFDVWCSVSPDCRFWGDAELVLGVEDVPFSNLKIGPGAPPIRTGRGWLTLFHATDVVEGRTFDCWSGVWKKRYTAGVMLLDLEKPWKVTGLSRKPLIVPEEPYDYEMKGFRGAVIFPTGFVAEPDGTAKIYYGAADTVMALATATIEDLLDLCEPV